MGIGRRSLAVVFALLFVLFAATTAAARWYKAERARRAREYSEVARGLEQRGRDAEAAEEYRNALGIAPANAAYRLALARALIRLRRDDEAAVYLQEVLRAHPSDAAPDLELARIAARQGRTAAAVDYYQRAIYGRWPEEPGIGRLQARWELADLLEKSGRRREIVAQMLEISEQARNDIEARKRAGAVLLAQGAAEQAEEVYRDLLRDAPRDAAAEAGLGQAQMARSHFEEARHSFRRALRLDERNSTARRGLDLMNEVLAIDPSAKGLAPRERTRRNLALTKRAAAALAACGVGTPPEGTAEELWAERERLCRNRPANDEALALVMAKVTK